MLVEVELYQIVITECSPTQVVVLKELEGDRCFPIYIHYNEAMAIDRKLKDIKVPRPLTHDLLKSVIEGMGGKLEKVVINDLSEGTYYARLVVSGPEGVVEIDSRPSDALALAVRVDVPIFAEDFVITRAMAPE